MAVSRRLVSLNAAYPMLVTLFGMLMLDKAVRLNALNGIAVTPVPMVTVARVEQI